MAMITEHFPLSIGEELVRNERTLLARVENGKPCNTLTPEQTARINDVLARLHKLFPKAKIVGHRDLTGTTPKECPCFDAEKLFGWIANT